MSTTIERVIHIVVENVNTDPEKITKDSDFEKHLDCDSLDMIEIVMAVEEAFDIEITDDEMVRIVTVQDAADLVDRHLAAKKETA